MIAKVKCRSPRSDLGWKLNEPLHLAISCQNSHLCFTRIFVWTSQINTKEKRRLLSRIHLRKMTKFFLNDFQVDRCLTYNFSSVHRQYNIVGLKVFYFQLSVYSRKIFFTCICNSYCFCSVYFLCLVLWQTILCFRGKNKLIKNKGKIRSPQSLIKLFEHSHFQLLI